MAERFKRLARGRNPRWALLEKRLEVPNYDNDGTYLTRWRLISTPIERRLDPATMTVNERRVVRRFNRLGLQDAHAILKILRRPTWTLLLVGPRVRTWGYWEPRGFDRPPQAWRWTEFDRHFHAIEFERAMERRRAG